MEKKLNVLFIDSKGISNVYGIGSYRNNLIPELGKEKHLNLFCISIKYGSTGGVKVNTIKGDYRCTYIEITFSSKDYSQKTDSLTRINAAAAKICFLLIKHFSKCKSGIVHLNSTGEVELARIAKQNGFSVLATQHVLLLKNNALKKNLKNDWAANMIENDRIFFSKIDGAIFLSSDTKTTAIKHFGVHPKKASLIYNGVPVANNQISVRDKIKVQLGFSKNDFIFLFVGRLEKTKGLHELIKAFHVFSRGKRNVKLVITGGGDFQAALSNTFKSLANIIFTGFLSGSSLKEIFEMADVGVLPSYSEQSSFTVMEMLSHKLPVIVSSIPGFDVFKDHTHVLKAKCQNGDSKSPASIDIESLRKCMEELYNDASMRSRLIRNSFKLVQEELNATYMAAKTYEFYKEIYPK